MTRALYFDCFSGCSGDMILGSLLDAGFALEELQRGLASLNLPGYQLKVERVMRSSISGSKFNVLVDEHDHHHHRGLSEILEKIQSSQLSQTVKEKSCAVFKRLGQVEAEIHSIPLEEVHFHEVGAIDSIIDIVGSLYALDCLKIERYFSSPLPVGSGTVKTAHGVLPVPAPATLKLLAMAGAPIISAPPSENPPGELVTPTGAALITSLATFSRPDIQVEKIGYGAGNKDLPDWPNVMRVWIGELSAGSESEALVLLETNIDDMNPQVYGYLMERLLAEKALDVWFTPIQMKKNRPAIMLSVLSTAEAEAALTRIILAETSTLGVRTRRVERHAAARRVIEIPSSLGLAHVKLKVAQDALNLSPEYEDCRRIALASRLPFLEVYRTLESEARHYLQEHPSA